MPAGHRREPGEGGVTSRIACQPIRAYLIAKGIVYVLIGLTWLLIPSQARELGIAWVPWLTSHLVAAMWIAGGAVAITSGIALRARRWGFFALQFVAFFLALVFAVSAVADMLPDTLLAGGRSASITTTVSYLGFWVSALIVAQVRTDGTAPEGADA